MSPHLLSSSSSSLPSSSSLLLIGGGGLQPEAPPQQRAMDDRAANPESYAAAASFGGPVPTNDFHSSRMTTTTPHPSRLLPPLRSHVALLAGLVQLQHQSRRSREDDTSPPPPPGKRSRRSSSELPHDDYVWRWWCHSYSHQERWYATQMLVQDFLNPEDESEDAFYVRRWVFLRRLVTSLGRFANPMRPLQLLPHQHQQEQQRRPNLTEWCATWQFVLGLRYTTTTTTTTTTTDAVLVPQQQNEVVAVVYHHWPWFCKTLWNFVLLSSSSPDYDRSSQHILAWIRMIYSWTVATEDAVRLPVVQTLHQCCLWNTQLLLRAHDAAVMEEDDDPRRVELLSPLAYLIATHCRIQDHHHRPAAAIEAQQLLSEMIHYRTSVRVLKTRGGSDPPTARRSNSRTTTTNPTKDDATSASVKTTKAGNAARTVPGDQNQLGGVAPSSSSRRLEKEIMIRFAQDGDDDDHGVTRPSQRHRDYDDAMDDLQSILLQSDHSSENDDDDDDDDENHDGDSHDEDDDDDHTIFDEDDNETVSSKTKKSVFNDTDHVAETNDTTIKPKEEDKAKIAKRPATSTDDATKSSKRPRMTTMCHEDDDVPRFERLVFGDDTYGKDKDDGDVDDDDDDDDFIEDDDDDEDDGAMDYVELDTFIRDDSLHRYRTTIAERQQEKHNEEGDGDTELVVNSSTTTSTSRAETSGSTLNPKDSTSTGSNNALSLESDNSSCWIERRKLYVLASMQVLMTLQHPNPEPKVQLNTVATTSTVDSAHPMAVSKTYLSIASENELIESINLVIKPPIKPVVTRIVLRRAPTQEEFFRGSLTRNPVPVNMLLNNGSSNTANSAKNRADTTSSSDHEPTIYDLRQYIATDLQMSDSAELIEIIVANKILDVNLKIRVVQQVLWKKSLIEHSSSSSNSRHHESTFGALTGFFASGSAMSFLLSSGVGGTIGSNGRSGSSGRVTADTPLAQLPPMMATYRLAGVDGEATEETVGVSDLIDPEAVSDTASPEEKDSILEAEFGMTRYVATGRGVQALLRSTQDFINDMLRRIRRDSIGGQEWLNPSRLELKQSLPCQALILLRYCAKLAINRKRMLEARAPTILLSLLIDILKALEDTSVSATTPKSNDSNPTTEILQELIELLTSDISSVNGKHDSLSPTIGDVDMIDNIPNTKKDVSSMSLLLQSIETIALSSPLRIVVAKLLPFLTYGQPDLCQELAVHFDKHINNDTLIDWEKVGNNGDDGGNDGITKNSILTNTFIQTALILPANDVCDGLRTELINCGFIERVVTFIAQDVPNNPTPWTPALWPVGELAERKESLSNVALEDTWRNYYNRPGVRTAFKILSGLSGCHGPTQSRIAGYDNFMRVCHWLESTSDSVSVATNGLGLLAETLLDEISMGNDEVTRGVKSVRNITRLRKKELAQEQRNRALQKITSFGGVNNFDSSKKLSKTQAAPSNLRQGFASILAPVVGLLQATSDSIISRSGKAGNKSSSENNMPSWFSEVEEMQDEVGLKCAVCQEGRTLQPAELLGLYVYIKKVSVSIDHGGSCCAIDGTNLIEALPSTLPESIFEDAQSAMIYEWFATTQSVVVNVLAGKTSKSSSSGSRHRQHVSYTTSVTAGNGIHYSCHRRARQADRSHPKAPKSEWEGATLRNSRVSCNAILPLVHGPNQSKIPLSTRESALSDHSEIVSNLTGSSHKSALWSVLHDIRLLLLRISYNESLSSDCGGGSLASNCQLLYHQIYLARMRDRNAAMDRYDKQAEHSMHAHGLSAGVLLATALINSSITTTAASDTTNLSVLTRHLADAAPMGALTAVVFPDAATTNTTSGTDLPMFFLQMLVVCAGRRHARGVTGSGCTSRPTMEGDDGEDDGDDGNNTEKEEDESPEESGVDAEPADRGAHPDQPPSQRRRASSKSTLVCDDFRVPLRPWLIYYLMLQQIQMDLTTTSVDPLSSSSSSSEDGTLCDMERCGERLVTLVTTWWACRTVSELLAQLPQVVTETMVLDWFQRGMMSS